MWNLPSLWTAPPDDIATDAEQFGVNWKNSAAPWSQRKPDGVRGRDWNEKAVADADVVHRPFFGWTPLGPGIRQGLG